MQSQVVSLNSMALLLTCAFQVLLDQSTHAVGDNTMDFSVADAFTDLDLSDCQAGLDACDAPGAESVALSLLQTSAYLRKAVPTDTSAKEMPAVPKPGSTTSQGAKTAAAGGGESPPGLRRPPRPVGVPVTAPAAPPKAAPVATDAASATEGRAAAGTGRAAFARNCGLASPSLLHVEMEVLRRTGYLPRDDDPCDVASLAVAWLGRPAALQEDALRGLFGVRSSRRHVTAAMYVVMGWAAAYMLLILRLGRGLFKAREPPTDSCKICKSGCAPSEEANAWKQSFFSWISLSWATPWVALLAFPTEGHAKVCEDDLGPLADPDDATEACFHRFMDLWSAEVESKGLAQASLKRVLFWFVGCRKILAIAVIVVCLQVIQYVVSIVMADLCLGYVDWMLSMREKDPHVKFQLAAPCGIMILGYTVIPLVNLALTVLVQLVDRRIDLRNEAALGMMIYSKALRLPLCYRQQSAGEDTLASSGSPIDDTYAKNIDVVQVISVDVKQNCAALASTISSLCCLPVFAVVVVAVAWYHLGRALLVGVLSIVPVTIFTIWLALRLQRLVYEFQSIMDRRLTLMQEVLFNIRVVKCYGWESASEAKVVAIRKQEISFIVFVCMALGLILSAMLLLPKLLSVGTLLSHVWLSGELRPHLIFVALQTLKNFLEIMQSVQGHAMKGLMAWPSLQRIECFLKLPEAPALPRAPPQPGPAGAETPALRLRGSFAWGKGGPHALHDLDLTVRHGALVAVVGEVGAGKSALLQAALGELQSCGPGSVVEGPRRVAYCAQAPWITAGTVRENVLGACAEAPDEQRYARAIAAAALQPDLEAWAGGDAAHVGGRGLALSGGQRMRVALARAAYDPSDLLLLDDPLAAVDTRTGEVLLQQLLMGSLMHGRTRLVVMQPDIDRLMRFDEIIVLSHGRIVGHGTPAEVMDSMSLRRFIRPAPVLAEASRPGREHAQEPVDRVVRSEQDVLALYADEGLGWANWDSLAFLLNQGKCRYVFLCALMQMACGATGLMSEIQFARWANSKHDTGHRVPDIAYILASGMWAGASAAVSVLNVSSAILFAKNAARSVFEKALHSVIRAPMPTFHDRTPVGQIMARFSYDLSMVDQHAFGKLMVLFGDPFLLVFGLIYVHTAMPRAFTLLSLPFYGVVIWLGSLYLKAIPALSLLNRAMLSKIMIRLVEVEDMRVAARAHGLVQHFQAEFAMSNDSQLKAQFLVSPTLGLWFRMRVAAVCCLLTTLIALCGIFAPQTLRPGTFAMCIGSLGHVMTSLPGVIESIAGLQFEFAGVRRLKEYAELPAEGSDAAGRGGAPRCAEELQALHQLVVEAPALESAAGAVHGAGRPDGPLLVPTEDGQALAPPVGGTLADLAPGCKEVARLPEGCQIVGVNGISGPAAALAKELCGPAGQRLLRLRSSWLAGGARVEIEGLCARYRASADVLRGVDLAFTPSQHVGIVGRTGCGKSTLLFTLLRIVEPRSGRVLLNGVDTATVSLTALRDAVGLVPQEPVLFSGTVRHNLDPLGQLTDKQLWEALRQVRASQCVESLPGRLEYAITGGSGGCGLSMGQRQLLCLARIVPKRPGLLLLDEATSSIDPCTQEDLISSIFGVFQQATIIAVAHKLETILGFDYCVVMDSGVVIEQGLVKDLQQANGVFARMLAASRTW